MNWITNFVRPKIGGLLNRKEMPENLWIKCPETGEMVFHADLEENMGVIPASGYHTRISARQRFEHFFDDGEYEKLEQPKVAVDPLKFRDKKRYTDRLKEARNKTGQDDSVLGGKGRVNGIDMIALAHEMDFVGGSLGMAAGEMIIAGMLKAVEEKKPLVMFAASGGARMQEGIMSLMQMPRTTVAVQIMREAKLPYIVVLTNPTTGGVSASYAMLGDIHIAEPGAVIGFAGRRVIEQTIRENLPEDFQTSEYLKEHGMVDMVVHRHDLKNTISSIVSILMKQDAPDLPKAAKDIEAAGDDVTASDEVTDQESGDGTGEASANDGEETQIDAQAAETEEGKDGTEEGENPSSDEKEGKPAAG